MLSSLRVTPKVTPNNFFVSFFQYQPWKAWIGKNLPRIQLTGPSIFSGSKFVTGPDGRFLFMEWQFDPAAYRAQNPGVSAGATWSARMK